MKNSGWFLATLAGCVALPSYSATNCEQLATLALPNSKITSAQSVPQGPFAPPGTGARTVEVPAFCQVSATLTPSPDSDIKIEVWLPATWNGKLLAVGNGGWSGAISYPAMVQPLQRGYAVTSTDTGHSGGSGSFAYGHPEKLIDFGWRAVHEMTLKAKAIVTSHYGRAARYSYWSGCSSGGKQGLKEAQKFPEDYDGIIAGAPAIPWTHLSAASLESGRAALPVSSPRYVPVEKYDIVYTAALKACDVHDGAADGLIEDPRRCDFDPGVLLCPGADEPTCLTQAQVETVKRIYAPVRNPRTQEYLFAGFSKGSERGWRQFAGGPNPLSISNDHYRYVVFENPDWDYLALDLDKDVAHAVEIDKRFGLNAADPDLSAFRKRGGKLLHYHGWVDGLIPAQNSIDYYEAVLKRNTQGDLEESRAKMHEWYRLFMVPGLGHCRNGAGTDQLETLTALERWVEAGEPPQTLAGSRRSAEGQIERSRELCPYPQVAHYKGSGDVKLAASFSCVTKKK